MATATLLPQPRLTVFDASGNPVAGGLIHTYIPGGTTPKTSWQDAAESIPNANPVVLDSSGSCLLYGSGSYQLTITDAFGVAIPGYSGVTRDTADGAPDATAVTYLPPFTGGVATTVSAKLSQSLTTTDFGAVGDGSNDDTAEIQAAIDALTSGGGSVILPHGTYRITASLKMRPSVRLVGTRAATIKQGNGANVTPLIDFNTHTAINAGLIGLTLDGNRANNTNSNLTYMVASTQVGTLVSGCAINNVPGLGLLLQGAGARVEDNDFSAVFSIAVALQGVNPATRMNAIVANNSFTNNGYFCIGGVWSDYNTVSGNAIIAPAVVSHVTTSGTAVTWVSGTNFAALLGGMFMRIAGTEFQIQSVNSTTSITLTASAGVLTNQPAISGTADCINFDSCLGTIITANHVSGGMSGGIMLHNSAGTVNAVANIVSGNNVIGVGNLGIGIISPGAITTVDSTIISNNTVASCGAGGAANTANTNDGIFVSGSLSNNTLISGNFLRDFPTPVQQYGVYIDASVVAGTTRVCGNSYAGNAVADTFGAGWTPYTVSLGSAGGVFTTAGAVGRYRQIDETVQFEVIVTITTNGTASGAVLISVPVPAGPAAYAVTGRATTSGKVLGGTIFAAGTTTQIENYDATYPGASGETLVISGTYESA